MIDVHSLLTEFFVNAIPNIEIYNEFSLQHELGIFLRNSISDFKVQFERNVEYFRLTGKLNSKKREIDISIFNEDKSEKYAVELKYCYTRVPDTMFDCVKDIAFMENLKCLGFTKTFCVALFLHGYTGDKQDGIYRYFRKEHSIYGNITGQTRNTKHETVVIKGKYDFKWNDIEGKNDKYYIISI